VLLFLTEHYVMKAYWGRGCIAPHILDLGITWRWVVSFIPRPLYSQGKSTWVGSRAGLDAVVGRKISRNPKFHYRLQKNPQLDPTLRQVNSVAPPYPFPQNPPYHFPPIFACFAYSLCPSGFPTKMLGHMLFLISPMRATCPNASAFLVLWP
jgi:hypothetical protein